jgi:glycosyltransferase involved in cell wall biosynthesis
MGQLFRRGVTVMNERPVAVPDSADCATDKADATTRATRGNLAARGLWITWEGQRRNASVAKSLSVRLCQLDYHTGRLRRYVRSLWNTFATLRRTRPQVLFVQNPSIVLTCAGLFWGRLAAVPVVVDAHNAALINLDDGGSRILRSLRRFAIRRAHLTIVTNGNLAALVTSLGGRPFVLPDPIPDLERAPVPDVERWEQKALFICSFATDEPFMAVLEAARALGPLISIYVTGNPGEHTATVRAAAPSNVVFTGYLPEADYVSLLYSVDVVIDLTTREDCLVCGAYEAVAAEQPMILSDTAALRSHFRRGVWYTDNSSVDLANGIRYVLGRRDALKDEVRELKSELVDDYERRRRALVEALECTDSAGRTDRVGSGHLGNDHREGNVT